MNTALNAQPVGYKAKAFEARNLIFFFLIAFLPVFVALLIAAGILDYPSNPGPGLIILLVVAQFSPLIAALVVTATTEGKAGLKALWMRFWNRDLSIKWAINLSFGGVSLNDGRTLQERLVDEATQAGIVVTVSAGNDGPSPGTVSRPGTAFSALTVGAATDPVHTRVFLDEFYGFVGAGAVLYPADELRVMEFSGQGPTADGRAGPDLVATGLFNFGLFPSPPDVPFCWSSGTSFAAPQVAGAAALLGAWAKLHDPSLDAWRIRRALVDGAVPLGDEWSVHAQGGGMLNLPNALAILSGAADPPGPAGPRAVRGVRARARPASTVGAASALGRLLIDPEQTLFKLGSITKLFTWTAVMQLVERGRLDLDADVNNLSRLSHPLDAYPQPITLRHLMTHTAGFEDLHSSIVDQGHYPQMHPRLTRSW